MQTTWLLALILAFNLSLLYTLHCMYCSYQCIALSLLNYSECLQCLPNLQSLGGNVTCWSLWITKIQISKSVVSLCKINSLPSPWPGLWSSKVTSLNYTTVVPSSKAQVHLIIPSEKQGLFHGLLITLSNTLFTTAWGKSNRYCIF